MSESRELDFYEEHALVGDVLNHEENMIFSLRATHDKEETIENIIRLYHENIGLYKSFSMDDLLLAISSYNTELMYDRCLLNLMKEQVIYKGMPADRIDTEVENEMASLLDFYSYNGYLYYLETDVLKILIQFKLETTIDTEFLYDYVDIPELVNNVREVFEEDVFETSRELRVGFGQNVLLPNFSQKGLGVFSNDIVLLELGDDIDEPVTTC